MAFKSISDLAKHFNKNQLKKALQEDVAKVARNTLKEHVIEDVYDAYDSNYQRTGGLLQDENIETKMEDDATLSIRSTRHEGNRDIAAVIEYGENYSYPGLDEIIGERPFHAETAKELDEKGLAKKALADGLKKQGIKVE
ncbi:hypothetical protein [Metabacillus sp. Hm71]|uniref:hypothetical protein n=1 Tax=Metabacillus sp. Hm71 TaxID=3450743 RepID=UPI003F41D57C